MDPAMLAALGKGASGGSPGAAPAPPGGGGKGPMTPVGKGATAINDQALATIGGKPSDSKRKSPLGKGLSALTYRANAITNMPVSIAPRQAQFPGVAAPEVSAGGGDLASLIQLLLGGTQ